MNFRQAVEECTALAPHFHSGLGGVGAGDRGKIKVRNPRNLRGSITVDDALRDLEPSATRWDYGVGHQSKRNSERVIWVEIHAASSSHVQPVIDKLNWLRKWLHHNAATLHAMPAHFVWVATGQVGFTRNSRQSRILAQTGLLFRPRVVDLDELCRSSHP